MIIRSEKYITNPTVVCSVISYNQKHWIGQCIDAIIGQKCDFPFTIVISDDCSTDGTQEVLKEYQARYPHIIKLVLNEKNQGITGNWVACCEAFEGGEFVTFCDGDDFWATPDNLQTKVDYLRQHPQCIGVTSNENRVDADGNIIKKYASQANRTINIPQIEIWNPNNIPRNLSVVMYRKDTFDKHIQLSNYIKYDYPFQDFPTILTMAAYGEFHYMPIVTLNYRVGHESDSHPSDLQKFERRMLRSKNMYEHLHTLFPNLDFEEGDFDHYMGMAIIKQSIKLNNYPMAHKYAAKLKSRSISVLCSKTRLTFHLYRQLRILKKRLH